MQRAQQQVRDQVAVGVRPLPGDERADMPMPEVIHRVLAPFVGHAGPVRRFSLLAWRSIDEAQARADIAELTRLLEAGELRAATTALPLAEIAGAHRQLEDRAVAGRLLLVP